MLVVASTSAASPSHPAGPSTVVAELLPKLGVTLARQHGAALHRPGNGGHHLVLGQIEARVASPHALDVSGVYERVSVFNHFQREPTEATTTFRHTLSSWAELAGLIYQTKANDHPSSYRSNNGAQELLDAIGLGLASLRRSDLRARYQADLGRPLNDREHPSVIRVAVNGAHLDHLRLSIEYGGVESHRRDALPSRRYVLKVPIEHADQFLELGRFHDRPWGYLEGGLSSGQIADMVPLARTLAERGSLESEGAPPTTTGPNKFAPTPPASRVEPKPRPEGPTILSVRAKT